MDEAPPPRRHKEDEPPASLPLELADRRTFLARTAVTATVAFLWFEGVVDVGRRRRVEPTRPGAPRQSLSESEWNTLEAAQARLLPSAEGSPGAHEVNAIGYLDAVLADGAIHEDAVARVRTCAEQLAAFARERDAEGYASLDGDAQDEGLRFFEDDWERQLALRNLIAFTMEAFLGDPVHGANPDRVGWTWAQHRPGYPRPQAPWRPRGEGPGEDGAR